MRISNDTIESIVTKYNLISSDELAIAKEQAERNKSSIQDVLLKNSLISEDALTKAFSDYSNVPFVNLTLQSINKDALILLPERTAREYKAIVFQVHPDGSKDLAMDDPDDVQAINFLEKELGSKLNIFVASHSSLIDALEQYHNTDTKEINREIAIESEKINNEEIKAVSEKDFAEDSPIAQTVNLILQYAINNHASDIHIEPLEGYIRIRYRIDGILKEVNRLPQSSLPALVSRIKILSNLKIDEHRVPQDGRFKVVFGSKHYAIRVSTLPTSNGEKTVMRILDETSEDITLEELGFWGEALARVKDAMTQSDSMVLVTGPTGSGKSTTLFCILSILNKPEVNISTIEDPIEYKIPGVNQTQTNNKTGMTFATGLRSLLRQDPNIIMVGEIRDKETADLATQAALTGHLVLSTLHTNDAATTLPRLLDMGIEPFLIASTVKTIVGQRLVRKITDEYRQSYTPSQDEITEIKMFFNLRTPNDLAKLHDYETFAAKAGLNSDLPLSTDENGNIKTLYRTDTTKPNNGFKGRIGIFEVLNASPQIQKLVMSNANSSDIETEAKNEGMLPMKLDGLIKALRGITTIEEVIRVQR